MVAVVIESHHGIADVVVFNDVAAAESFRTQLATLDPEALCFWTDQSVTVTTAADALRMVETIVNDTLKEDDRCPECERSNGPHYRGPCEHGGM